MQYKKACFVIMAQKTTFQISNIRVWSRFSSSINKGSPQLIFIAYNAKNTKNNLG